MVTLHNISQFKTRRKELRKQQTPAEQILWDVLRNRKIGFKFRRQHSIGGYILDFYCPEKLLGIELDGEYHNEEDQKEYDQEREGCLKSTGITLIHFQNDEITSDLESVMIAIHNALQESRAEYYKDRIV
jgi:very-short-patch-repair endonuclease